MFGSITNGASDDLQKVAVISRRMIHEWAMGTSVSAIQLVEEGGAVSDRTRELRDAEQQHLADEAMRRAVAMITGYRPQLDAIAAALLQYEVLEGGDIARIIEGVERPEPSGAHLRVAAATPTNVQKDS